MQECSVVVECQQAESSDTASCSAECTQSKSVWVRGMVGCNVSEHWC